MSLPPKPADAAATVQTATRTVRCPTCGGDSVYAPSNPWRPFCSERCRQIDLGAWASESFRVEATPPSDDPELEQ
jgi:endogenous inhibitor of DNA gyrase (YacG/DUF329 family)